MVSATSNISLLNAVRYGVWHVIKIVLPSSQTSSARKTLLTTPFGMWYAVCLLFVGIAASLSTDAVRVFAVASGAFLLATGAFIATMLPMLAPRLQPASFVFFGWTDATSGSMPSNT